MEWMIAAILGVACGSSSRAGDSNFDGVAEVFFTGIVVVSILGFSLWEMWQDDAGRIAIIGFATASCLFVLVSLCYSFFSKNKDA